MKKVFILVLLAHSFQGFLIAQEISKNLEVSESRIAVAQEALAEEQNNGNYVEIVTVQPVVQEQSTEDDLDDLLNDSDDNNFGAIAPTTAPQKNNASLLAVCAHLVKMGIRVTAENIRNLFVSPKTAKKNHGTN